MGATTETHFLRRDQRLGNPSGGVLRAGVGLSSFAALLLELVLTRIFSVVLFYHFAFLAISIALLGLGAGGVFAYLKKSWLLGFETRGLVAALSLCNALAVPVLLEIVLHVPVSLQFSTANLLRLTVLYLSSGVPFFFTGLGLSTIFARLVWSRPAGSGNGMFSRHTSAEPLGRTEHHAVRRSGVWIGGRGLGWQHEAGPAERGLERGSGMPDCGQPLRKAHRRGLRQRSVPG
jgi:hypothetical protein